MRGRIYRWWRMALHPSQAWFWTRRWQEGEARAQADIDAGRTKAFGSSGELLAWLSKGDDSC